MTNSNLELQHVIADAAKDHFWAFCNHYDYNFFQKRKFLKEPAIAIHRLFNKEIKRMAIALPPRSGKSYLASLAAAYSLGKNPEESVMRNSCTSTLFNKFSYDVRDIVKSDKFKEIFPNSNLSRDKTAVTGWNMEKSKQVGYFGNGVTGTIIGFGASGIAITDDLYKSHEEALSETINDKTHRWHESAHMSRLEKGCPELDIGTRWHNGDVIGKRIDRGDYDEVISIPALIEGETFCEDVHTTEEFLYLKKITDKFIWLSEYMQDPIDVEGLVFPLKELTLFSEKNKNRGIRVAFIDTADQGEDYLSMPIVEYFAESSKGYLIDVVFNQENLTVNESIISAKLNELNVNYCGIETNKEGTYFINNMRKLNPNVDFYGQFNSSNKLTRILMQSGWIKNHICFDREYEQKDEYLRFMRNLTTYLRTGDSKHDDAPDSLAGLAGHLRRIFGF